MRAMEIEREHEIQPFIVRATSSIIVASHDHRSSPLLPSHNEAWIPSFKGLASELKLHGAKINPVIDSWNCVIICFRASVRVSHMFLVYKDHQRLSESLLDTKSSCHRHQDESFSSAMCKIVLDCSCIQLSLQNMIEIISKNSQRRSVAVSSFGSVGSPCPTPYESRIVALHSTREAYCRRKRFIRIYFTHC